MDILLLVVRIALIVLGPIFYFIIGGLVALDLRLNREIDITWLKILVWVFWPLYPIIFVYTIFKKMYIAVFK